MIIAGLLHRISIPVGLHVACLLLFLVLDTHASQVRIKDICEFQDSKQLELIGYGLVIGLDGTGDGNGTQFTTRSLANLVQRMGLTVEPEKIKVKNIAAVIVTATMAGHQSLGSHFDVTVSSIGDASSLQGGTLLLTPLSAADGVTYAVAQGAVSIGGFNVQVDEGNRIVNNYTLVGRIPNGAKVTVAQPSSGQQAHEFTISIRQPDNATASRVADRINLKYGTTAFAVDAGSVHVTIPDSLRDLSTRGKFLADIGMLTVTPDNAARVVINERTGTIVTGKNVTIEPVAIAHGTITVNIQSRPIISQPDPFSHGETVIAREPSIAVDQEVARVVELGESVSLADIATALNKIGATPRDIIAIFQALKQAGALRAELVIL